MLLTDAKKSAATLNEGRPDEKQIDGLIAQLEDDYRQAELNEADRQMLDYSSKLTAHPQAIDAADVQKLRDVGFDDLAIHDIVCCVSYFAFVNRIADGLGVELESPT